MAVSKYVGETEKNRGVIFKHVINSMAVLFFDEADAFFGRRTHAKGAYVRYADSEANFLLLKTENHKKGIVLTTNMRS